MMGGMADFLSPAERSAHMAKVRAKDTKPELKVRSLVHRLGYRFRLHRRDLPGTPDLVFPSSRKVIFVHGCFWHRHPNCRSATTPKSRAKFWKLKFDTNVTRDATKIAHLKKLGWRVLILWECQVRDGRILERKLITFLKPS